MLACKEAAMNEWKTIPPPSSSSKNCCCCCCGGEALSCRVVVVTHFVVEFFCINS